MRKGLFSLMGVAVLGLALCACSAVAAHAAPMIGGLASAVSVPPDVLMASMAVLGATASVGLQADDDAAGAVAVAPRVTLEGIEAKVVREETHVFDDLLTVHVLTMANGFKVTGESACASPENFNAELGVKIARDQAIRKAWGFEGYLLREQLSQT